MENIVRKPVPQRNVKPYQGTTTLILLLQWCHNDLPVVGQWSISDYQTCHFDNLLTIVRSVIDHCDTIAIAD